MCFSKQKTAYEVRISDWSSDVCSSDLGPASGRLRGSIPPSSISSGWCATCPRTRCAGSSPPSWRPWRDRKSVVLGKRASVRVDIGGRRMIKKQSKLLLDPHHSRVNSVSEPQDINKHITKNTIAY